MQRIDYIVHLLKDFLTEDLDVQRAEESERLFSEYPYLKEVVDELDSEDGLRKALGAYEELHTDEFREREEKVLQRVLFRVREQQSPSTRRVLQRRLAIYSSVAAIIITVCFAVVIFQNRFNASSSKEAILSSFVAGRNKATLKLSNGEEIDLSDAHFGIVVNNQIVYEDGTGLFNHSTVQDEMNLTLSTPRGGQYQVVLSDGTKVWLNAESKLHYPYHFSADERRVELEGEAYFEVAPQENSFIVTTSKETVEVLGTHFNVNSYPTDINSAVSLLEGKVRVSSGTDAVTVLEPGQQSVITNGRMKVRPINVEESVAWKNGEFMFNNETLDDAMKKIERWYDLDIELSADIKNVKIWGSVSRYDDFNTVLNLIKMTDDNIRFEVNGRRVKFVK